jgi:hypothetical protein
MPKLLLETIALLSAREILLESNFKVGRGLWHCSDDLNIGRRA